MPALATILVLALGAWGGLALREGFTAATLADSDRAVTSSAPASTGAASPTTGPTATGTPTPPAAASGLEPYEQQVVDLVNAERATAGCGPLTVDSRLVAAARAHSADMAARGYFDHTTPEGVTFDQRITQAGFRWSYAAENIARGYSDPESVMRGWMNSDGHRRNILNCRLTHIGVGLAYDANNRPHWTQDFATPR